MQTNRFSVQIRYTMLAVAIIAWSAVTHAGGAVTIEKKPDPFQGIPGPVISKDGKPVKAMVMPISVTLPPEVKMSDEEKEEFRTKAWKIFGEAIDASGKFERVPAPDGAEADEIVKKTMAHAAGIVSAQEFKKIKEFKLPERFIYGHVSILVEEEESLQGLTVKKTIKYHVDAQVRLVESKNFTYQPSLATGKAADMKSALKDAVKNAVARYRLSEDEKATPDSGGDPLKGGGFFGG